ncbi:hypothetical protein LQZ18_01700 [Lachnospiraceae bacterium ZAX-1]
MIYRILIVDGFIVVLSNLLVLYAVNSMLPAFKKCEAFICLSLTIAFMWMVPEIGRGGNSMETFLCDVFYISGGAVFLHSIITSLKKIIIEGRRRK